MSWLLRFLGLSRQEPSPAIKAGTEAAEAATSAIEGATNAAATYWKALRENAARDDAEITDDYRRAERTRTDH